MNNEIAVSCDRGTESSKVAIHTDNMRREVIFSKLPWGIWLIEKAGVGRCLYTSASYKFLVFVLTFCCYTSYHLSRKPTSVVKVVLCPHCANCSSECVNCSYHSVKPGWAPFNGEDGNTLLGVLDYSWLFSYAIAMYFSGFLSDRLNLRYFLTVGMIGSGVSVCLLGVAYFANIHKLYYFILVQVFGGIMQSTGWPGVVAVMSHWFGKHNRGLIMGIWNSHTSVGNILGTIIPSFWADCEDVKPWGWSFLIPGFIIIFFGILTYLFLVSNPLHVGTASPVHHLAEDLEEEVHRSQSASLLSQSILNSSSSTNRISPLIKSDPEEKSEAVNFFQALMIPGVVEFSLALFFNKLVSYTFLYWLPLYVKLMHSKLSGPESDWLSTAFDVGGIIGGILAGVISDRLNARASTCVVMLVLAVPSLFILRSINVSLGVFVTLLVINGIFVNGPYGMITTAVSSDLGTHPSLKASINAKATVTAIIDGTGSLGAAVGPLLVGVISHYKGWDGAFYLLMSSCLFSALLLSRLVVTDVMKFVRKFRGSRKYTPL